LGLGFVLSCANLDFIALNLSVWREKKYEKRLKGQNSLFVSPCSLPLCVVLCQLPIAICQCFVEEEDEEWGLEGTKMDVDEREN
jgi:hypothetical protein